MSRSVCHTVLYNFSLVEYSPHGFQTACSQAYYTVFSDSISDPLERHNSTLASRALIANMLCDAKVPRARPGRIRKLEPYVIPLTVTLTPGPTPASSTARVRTCASGIETSSQTEAVFI